MIKRKPGRPVFDAKREIEKIADDIKRIDSVVSVINKFTGELHTRIHRLEAANGRITRSGLDKRLTQVEHALEVQPKARIKKSGWVNIYSWRTTKRCAGIYPTKEEAAKRRDRDDVATIHIEWEE